MNRYEFHQTQRRRRRIPAAATPATIQRGAREQTWATLRSLVLWCALKVLALVVGAHR